jgi:uncharacterized protein (DUF1015 family)
MEVVLAAVWPFKGIRYNSSLMQIGSVLCPPFDQITPLAKSRLLSRDSHNIVRLEAPILGLSEDQHSDAYTDAASLLNQWLTQSVFICDEKPAYYLLKETFGENLQVRLGLYAAVEIENYDAGVILPHEHTRKGPKEDRLRLLEACNANFSPIMVLYWGNEEINNLLNSQMLLKNPDYSAQYADDCNYEMWIITDQSILDTIKTFFDQKRLFIADGHHRYETALTYKDSMNDYVDKTHHNKVMMCLIDIMDTGLKLESFHRIINGLSDDQLLQFQDLIEKYFVVESFDSSSLENFDLNKMLNLIETKNQHNTTFGFVDVRNSKFLILSIDESSKLRMIPNPEMPDFLNCEPWILHSLLIDPLLSKMKSDITQLEFVYEIDLVRNIIEENPDSLVFLLPCMAPEVFVSLVEKGARMPPKSTYFSPKLPTGLVMNMLER